MDSTPEPLRAVWLGRAPFEATQERQLATREAIVAGQEPQTLYLVEHPPTLTMGRRASADDLLWAPERMAQLGLTVCDTPRGGEVTLHAPGQLVVYPVVRVGRQIREHIQRMGRVGAGLVTQMGVEGAEFRMDHPGVWVGPRKIGSIGIHVSRGVAVQGMSLNLDVDPALFGALVSCGLPGVEVVSVSTLLPSQARASVMTVEEAGRAFAARFAADLGVPLQWGDCIDRGQVLS